MDPTPVVIALADDEGTKGSSGAKQDEDSAVQTQAELHGAGERRASVLRAIIPSAIQTPETEPERVFHLGKDGTTMPVQWSNLSFTEDDDEPYPSPQEDVITHGQQSEEGFKFLPPGEEPVLDKKFRKRADKALKKVASQVFKAKALQELPKREFISGLSPQLKNASSMGFNAMKSIMFPAMPQLLQDLWVFMEFIVTVLSFILAMVGLDLSENKALNTVALILSIVGIILAFIDGYIYFFYISHLFRTCATLVSKRLPKKGSSGSSQGDKEDGSEEMKQTAARKDEAKRKGARQKLQQLSDKAKEILDTWFEVGRTVISEIILYPTLVCDLLDFVSGVTEVADDLKEDPTNRLDFSLFLVGNIYTIIAVYFMRLLVIIGMIVQIRKMPTLSSGSPKGYMAILGRFCFHVVCQVVCHGMIVVALSAKIHQENPGDQDNIRVSPFLWIMIILGGIIPLAGIATFFLANYYWMREFSVSIWLDLVSLLQGESFSEVVLGGDPTTTAMEKSKSLAEMTGFSDVKKQLKDYKKVSLWTKATYPLQQPLLLLLGVLYDLALIAFVVSMTLSTDPDTGEVRFVLFETEFLPPAFFIILACLLVANYQVLAIINMWLACAFLLSVLVAIVAPLALVFYIAFVLCGTCLHTVLPKLL